MLKKIKHYFWNKLPVPSSVALQEAKVLPITQEEIGYAPQEPAQILVVDDATLQKLKTLLRSGDEVNILLAFQLMKGLPLTEQHLNRLIRDKDKREYLCFRNGYLVPFMNLSVLDFGRWKQKIKEVPYEIQELTSLKRIILPGHHLTTLPDEIGALKDLEWLNLYDNRINVLPEAIGELDGLRWLFLRDNFLETLPHSVGNLKSLIRLNLSNNQLRYIPEEVGFLPMLDELNLNNNSLTELPPSLGELKKLTRLYIKDNPISFQKRGELQRLLPNTKIFF
ncbi:hypothetical protein BKI52_23730 [marine bacterium AO1-C]|nr:hypothetical protein BKI52_23730 [marine bacterium AO1-C]